jgi:hypothetical protein
MKTLTVRQPWASLIVTGAKDVENRSWPTSYRGTLLIHAGVRLALSAPFPPSSGGGCASKSARDGLKPTSGPHIGDRVAAASEARRS